MRRWTVGSGVDVERLRALAEPAAKAHPGEWTVDRTPHKRKFVAIVGSDGYVIPTAFIAEYIAAASPSTVLALIDENTRLTACLAKANANHEHFEREMYLAKDELERVRKLAKEALEIGRSAIANLDIEHDEGLASNAFNAAMRLAAIEKELGNV